MIASERGRRYSRVVLQVRTAAPRPQALEAAMRLARALETEMQSLFVRDEDLVALDRLSCAREFSLISGRTRQLTPGGLEHELRRASLAARHRIETLAKAMEIAQSFEVVDAGVLEDMAGERAIVALTEPLRGEALRALNLLYRNKPDIAGFLVFGANISRLDGPVMVIAERASDLAILPEAAARLAAASGTGAVLAMAGESRDATAELVRKSRVNLPADWERVALDTEHAEQGVLAEAVRRRQPGLVIASADGALCPSGDLLGHFIAAIGCPLLLLR